jgi:glycine dehydrogenase subunit 1
VSFLSLTPADREAMLATVGVGTVEELFRDIPEAVRLRRPLDLEPALSEQELARHLGELAARNTHAGDELSFLGYGVYDHYTPAVVDVLLARGEFLTAYTPYQPEMSQGVLQAIFEYQTAICELTGLDVSNASGYDGCTVAADACFVARHHTGRSKVVLAETLHPMVRQVVATFAPGFGMEVVTVPHAGGVVDAAAWSAACEGAACAIFQTPNVFGVLEDGPSLAAAANEAGALPVAHVDLLSLGVLEAPGAYGCAIAIGEGQSTGVPMSFGGPHYGFMAARADLVRRMPGRIVGETLDSEGKRAFVLTLQTREQHIRREKATSNMTTNQTLIALAGWLALCWHGPQGLRELGALLMSLSAHATARTAAVAGLEPAFPGRTTFKEVSLRLPGGVSAEEVARKARALGVNPGIPLGRDFAGLDDVLLVAVTERRTPAEIERFAEVIAACS